MNQSPGITSVRLFALNLEFITNLSRWQQVVEALPDFCGKVYYHASYYSAFTANGDGQAAALYYRNNETEIFYPFLIRPVPEGLGGKGCFDMQSAYGYGGPAVFKGTGENLEEFARLHAEWAEKASIIAEFVRFNPLMPLELPAMMFTRELNRKTVSIKLVEDFNAILHQASGPRRRNYRKAVRAGLKFVTLPHCDEFIEFYQQAMQRLAADSYYYFSPEHFAALARLPQQNLLYTGVKDANENLVAAGIFLLDAMTVHYHLGASAEQARDMQPDAFMLFETARYASKIGKKLFHLGGGLSLNEDDGLFRFKAGFSQQRHDFFIARKIHRPQQYHEISSRWQAKTAQKPSKLLHYHEGIEHADL